VEPLTLGLDEAERGPKGRARRSPPPEGNLWCFTPHPEGGICGLPRIFALDFLHSPFGAFSTVHSVSLPLL